MSIDTIDTTETTETKKIVVKFGGSNLKRKEDIAALIRAVRSYRQPVVIVVSALYGVTDTLVNALHRVTSCESTISAIKDNLLDTHLQVAELYIEEPRFREQVTAKLTERLEELEKNLRGVNCLGETPDFVEDRVLSYGERLSSLLLTSILTAHDIPCRECLPEELGLFTNGEYRNATVDFEKSEAVVKQCVEGNHICIIPGFYGISLDAKVTLLGRGGSDYTAAAIARCIDAESVDLWKDVPGFLSADPKQVDNTSIIRTLTYSEAEELCYFGARIAHPRTFEPLADKKIPVRLFNIDDFSDDPEPVTIIRDQGVISKEVVKSVTYSDDFGVLKLHGAGVGIKPGILAKVTSCLSGQNINIKSVITSQTCINILLAGGDLEKGLDIVQRLGLTTVDRITSLDDISLIAVVGEGILEQPGIAARVLSAVSVHNINVWTISAGASNVAVYFIINREDRQTAIQAIHREFFGHLETIEEVAAREAFGYKYDYSYVGSLGYVV
jgi:aspartate kinase/aspartokinase/homoserine dehydrogenase 1